MSIHLEFNGCFDYLVLHNRGNIVVLAKFCISFCTSYTELQIDELIFDSNNSSKKYNIADFYFERSNFLMCW